MIRVSTRGRYALRAVVDVYLNSENGPALRQGIADRQAISADYVAQLFRKLAKAGILRSVRGPGGGYLIGRDPTTITAGDVLRAVEGPIAVVHCVEPGESPSCERADTCITHLVWRRLSDVMAQFLDSLTLESLRDEALMLQAAGCESRDAVSLAACDAVRRE
jgi:Rrf2 family protein